MHGCLNLVFTLTSQISFLLFPLFLGMVLDGWDSCCCFSLVFFAFRGFLGWHTCGPKCLHLIAVNFQWPKRSFLRDHGRVGPLQIPRAWTQPSWSGRSCPTSTTRAAVLSSMVWTHADGNMAITTDVTASVSTSVPSSVQHATAWTLFWESIHESDPCLAVGHLAHVTLSTSTSFISSTYFSISISKPSINSTMLTHTAMSTHSSGIAQHSNHSFVSASSSWHSIWELTRWSHNCWWQPYLWIRSYIILIGKRIKTTTTIRRSTAWLSLGAFVNQPSRKNWTLKDVILWNYLWPPCCINRQTTFGFGSWLMGVKATWFRLGTLQLLCSWRSSWLNSATKG